MRRLACETPLSCAASCQCIACSGLLTPIPRPWDPLHRSRNGASSSLSEGIKLGLDYQGKAARNLSRPRAPRLALARHRMGDTTHQDDTRGGASQPSPPHT